MRFVCVIRVIRVSRLSLVCPGSSRCLFSFKLVFTMLFTGSRNLRVHMNTVLSFRSRHFLREHT